MRLDLGGHGAREVSGGEIDRRVVVETRHATKLAERPCPTPNEFRHVQP
jgi:hypothetical protein